MFAGFASGYPWPAPHWRGLFFSGRGGHGGKAGKNYNPTYNPTYNQGGTGEMRGLVWDGARLFCTNALEVRAPGKGEVKVRVLASGICHTDLNMLEGGQIATPVVLGHEAAGVVAELGEGVSGLAVGDAVMVGTQTPCGHCRECKRGEPANCDETW